MKETLHPKPNTASPQECTTNAQVEINKIMAWCCLKHCIESCNKQNSSKTKKVSKNGEE